jgi:hypothetical protein
MRWIICTFFVVILVSCTLREPGVDNTPMEFYNEEFFIKIAEELLADPYKYSKIMRKYNICESARLQGMMQQAIINDINKFNYCGCTIKNVEIYHYAEKRVHATVDFQKLPDDPWGTYCFHNYLSFEKVKGKQLVFQGVEAASEY